jgi:hypothetical protein
MSDLSIEEHEEVLLTEDLPESELRAGDRGVVVMVHRAGEGNYTGPDGYTVEFPPPPHDGSGVRPIVSLSPEQVRPADTPARKVSA